MPKTYDPAPPHVRERLNALIAKSYPELASVKIRIDLVYASNDGEGPAVTLGGYQCAAIVRRIGLKDRAMGRGDAEIVIDRDMYESWGPEKRDALLDHELYHIELVKSDGAPAFDDQQRPLLKMRKHDHQFGWFDEIARRHGEHAIEVQQARAFAASSGQLYFDFAPRRKTA